MAPASGLLFGLSGYAELPLLLWALYIYSSIFTLNYQFEFELSQFSLSGKLPLIV